METNSREVDSKKGHPVRLLLVEDEAAIASSLKRGLQSDGFAVEIAENGKKGLWLASLTHFDVIILDLMLPGLNGFSVCHELRERGVWTPILVLTAKTGEFDEIESLDSGADDFLTKPFSYPVLLAHIRSLLRRDPHERPVVLEVGDLRLDPATRSCWRGDLAITLTPREFDLLEYLMRNVERVISKDEILDHVWGPDFEGSPNIVEVYVGYLRRKIDRPFNTTTIVTALGSGYRLLKNVS